MPRCAIGCGELNRLLCALGITTIYVTHDQSEAMELGDRIVVMQEGAISGTLNRDQFSEENVMRLAVARGAEQSAA